MAERRAATTAHALRRELLSRRRWLRGMWWVGVGAAGVGLYLALVGVWPAAAGCFAGSAALLWLSGTWVLPWSRDGYLKRLGHVWTNWGTEAQWAYDVYSRPQSRLTGRLERLSPPPGFEDEHAGLMALLPDAERLSRDQSTPFAERARQAVAALNALDETNDRLADTATTDAQRRYAAALDELLSKRLAEYAAATRKAEQTSEKAVRILARMRAPAAAASTHAELVEASRSYVTALRECHTAAQSRNRDRAIVAARGVELAEQQLAALGAAVAERLDYAARWPLPSGPTDDPHTPAR